MNTLVLAYFASADLGQSGMGQGLMIDVLDAAAAAASSVVHARRRHGCPSRWC